MVTLKGQATIPKSISDQLDLTQGNRVDSAIYHDRRVVLRKTVDAAPATPDRFDRLVGCGTAPKGKGTDEIMRLLRGEDDGDDG
jgi:bifunctional DNA-binding transcriptional regulator/antitoxin component of YhaV-PrlF toxin-antitoxin module